MHYQGFPTSNHYGATADGLVLGYRVGAKLLYADTLQYHPTGAAFPQQMSCALVVFLAYHIHPKLARDVCVRRGRFVQWGETHLELHEHVQLPPCPIPNG